MKDRISRADKIRTYVRNKAAELTIRGLEEASGVSRTVLHDFIGGATPQEKNLELLEAWVEKERRSKGGDTAENPSSTELQSAETEMGLGGFFFFLHNWLLNRQKMGSADYQRLIRLMKNIEEEELMDFAKGDHHVEEEAPISIEREWQAALRDITRSDADPDQKMRQMDALASLIGRVAWARSEEAAIQRAGVLRSGDEASAARAAASDASKRAAKEVSRAPRSEDLEKEKAS